MINQFMLELAEEIVNPEDVVLDDQIEDTIENEEEIMIGIGDDDDAVIDFINSGKRLVNSDPVDFTDDDVEETLQDEDEITTEQFNLDDIEDRYGFEYY